ncbi:MAG TPA: EfeM/EfeO family lipoprotein [Solirubrobacteraceae bacterium]|jgi:high-affinity iron transporter|nr:EfeM/EfeO family lipoprotein [Solirubrobacteraceae bacterium]
MAARIHFPFSRLRVALMAVMVLALAGVVGAALAPSGGHHSRRFFVRAVASTPRHTGSTRVLERTVFGSSVPASKYGTQIADLEDQGISTDGQLASDLPPIPPPAFRAPENRYRAYAVHWTMLAAGEALQLRARLAAGDRPGAERAWARAWDDYLHLGAVYGLFGNLDEEIDGLPGGLLGGASSAQFTGLHRIEMGLWTGAPTSSLVAYAERLHTDLLQLPPVERTVVITPLQYATRAHEILEDAQRDFLSGVDVPWSDAGVLATDAGLAATREVIGTLTPLLTGRDSALAEVRYELGLLGQVLGEIRHHHRGGWPTLAQLSPTEHEDLNGTMAGVLQALSLVPGALETTAIPNIPSIPQR